VGIETQEWRPVGPSSETGCTDLPGLGGEEHFRDHPEEGTCPTSFERNCSEVKLLIDIGRRRFNPGGEYILSFAKPVSRITEHPFN
jgi:hypothetical protein